MNRLFKINKYIISLVFLSLISLSSASADQQAQRNSFLQAYDALHKGGLYDSTHLRGYLLHPYLDYERIKKNLKKTSDHALMDFINKNQNSWLANDLRSELLGRLGKQRNWKSVLRFYKKGAGGNKAKCVGLEAEIHTTSGSVQKKALNQAMDLWLSGHQRPQVCNTLFSMLKQKRLINNDTAWKRIVLLMDKGKTTLSKHIAKHTNSQSLVALWKKVRKNPEKHLKNKLLKNKDARTRHVIAYGIKRLARKNINKANNKWIKFQKSHAFSAKEKADVASYIGVRQALDHSPYALQKLSSIPANFRSEDGNLWMARMAIRQGDWKKLLNAIVALPADKRSKDIWQYWRAYAERQTGQKVTINLSKLAENASFYGFLAADQLKQPYKRLLQKEPNWNALIPRVKNKLAFQRATELFAIGKPKLAKKEWFWALKKLSKNDKLVAAAYAHQINQPFLGIVTVSKTKDWNQSGLRFPLRYQSLVQKVARSQGIVPAWVYGIMRRESAFDPVIVSSANAKGLMQVLPGTAKNVAKKLGIRGHKTSDLLIPEKNALIGAGYLKQMLKRFKGNYVKATASYNAGPHRIPRWLPDYPIAAPRWIESIPFTETRNYVRAVMSYTTIYDHKLNYKNRRNLRLSQRLQVVKP